MTTAPAIAPTFTITDQHSGRWRVFTGGSVYEITVIHPADAPRITRYPSAGAAALRHDGEEMPNVVGFLARVGAPAVIRWLRTDAPDGVLYTDRTTSTVLDIAYLGEAA